MSIVIYMIYFLSSTLKYVFLPYIDLETFAALVKVSKQFSSITTSIIASEETYEIIAASNICLTNISLRLSNNFFILYKFPRLKHLSITVSNRKRLNDDIYISLARLVDLVSFELINCKFRYYDKKKNEYNAGNHFKQVFSSNMKKLEKVKLINCKDVNHEFIKSLKQLPNLKTLILEECKAKISERSIKDITEIKKLETLSLSDNTSVNEQELRNSLINLNHLMYVKYPSGKVDNLIRTGESP